ncbi:nitroreductase family deazaflavin-dependent oxidoreductase [Candidatus Mycobacterium wuenschmannii]|uniref:Nitroreductase family deazaflavin-dependent oxidoreductase n=1 Tax=Candidatus Mycobacterium wuenschmannii TaxID=3027808 RepID=A0ABY8W6S8_9MYCO|nr:nitroreductase family deazaflavin-dependent oxidoreductase [Candidatus Mycobacterium wuenschmannii]WIM90157.1 nitroreductase family deazaflavin-dependent oxidoreductase [Candidatus Mycobacterium wuenschmannii]
MRIPIWAYRLGAGALFGERLIMLQHIGRKTGNRRYVVLEVIGHPTPQTYLVASGFGEKAQWFRNVSASPRAWVYVSGRSPVAASARILPRHEADHALGDYIKRHPRAWARFRPVLEHTLGCPIAETNTALPIVEFRLD